MRAAELDRCITLLEPTKGTRSAKGAVNPGEPARHPVWAARLDRGGGERFRDAAVVGAWQSRFTVRWSRTLAGIDHRWSLEDERGKRYDIEAVAEMGRREGWLIYAVSRTLE